MTEARHPAFDPVAWWARTAGTRIAVIDAASDRRVSYAQLHADANRWGRALHAHGVRVGERVAVLAHNRYEYLPLFIACLRRGAVLVPLNWRLAAPELARVLKHAEPVLLFSETRFAAFRELARDIGWLDFDTAVPAWLAQHDAADAAADAGTRAPDSCCDGDTLAMLLYTSGTTGEPKGVMVTHRQLLWNATSTCLGWALGEHDVAAISTPLFHTAAWHVFATPLLTCGGGVVVLPNFDAHTFLGALARYDVTRAFCVPTQWQMLQGAADFGRSLPAMRTFISGGAPLAPHSAQMLREAGYLVRDAYGLTECGPNCFVIADDALTSKPGSVGWPLPFVQMRVLDAGGRPVGVDVVGELQLRAPQLFGGYFRDAARTAAAMTGDGWFRTGDLVSVDADGAYRVRGRLKDLFISGGENVFPGEVEAALHAVHGVREVVVVGVPDPVWGEVGCAVVVPARTDLHAADVLRDVRGRLAGYKVPKTLVLVPQLPVLGSGKVDRDAVRSLALRAARGEH